MVPSFDPELNMIYIGTSVTLAPDIATIRARAGGPKARQQRNLFLICTGGGQCASSWHPTVPHILKNGLASGLLQCCQLQGCVLVVCRSAGMAV
jgi:hypothetical protein